MLQPVFVIIFVHSNFINIDFEKCLDTIEHEALIGSLEFFLTLDLFSLKMYCFYIKVLKRAKKQMGISQNSFNLHVVFIRAVV